MIPMIVRVWCESGAGWAPALVPVTPQSTCRDVLDCCREPGDEPCLLLSVHPAHGVHVLKDTDLPLEVVSTLGPDVQFVLKYVEVETGSTDKSNGMKEPGSPEELVDENQFVCQACWNYAFNASRSNDRLNEALLGHRRVCINCGRSVLRQRFHPLRTDSVREERIYNVIQEWIMPRNIGTRSVLCHSCWVRANRAAPHFVSGPSTSSQADSVASASRHQDINQEQLPQGSNVDMPNPQASIPTATIVLPDYIRAVETERRCFIEGCQAPERHRVPLNVRKMLLNTYNYYVPINNRLCSSHLISSSWDFLNGLTDNYINTFNASQIQDMLSLKTCNDRVFDFESLSTIEDHIFYYWVGFTKNQFIELLNEVPQLQSLKKQQTALAAYLIKLRNGDSGDRLGTLFQMPRSTLESMIGKVRTILHEYFVPQHIGFNHINRTQLMQRNLQIPNALFGNYNNEIKPIIICDGTYCYIQKSSNYKYQKDTYSLHKYRNLVKPFLMVCTDGHIIDVLGPFPATTSDADIMKNEFVKPEFQEYFQPGDAFILDRGFRDALSVLQQYGYRTFVPSTLQEGETQLSTLEANKSRAVTICRWVVEVVNGRFKRDFKLLRQEYFNVSAKSLMINFEIAAALINRFHPPIIDRVDAGEIIRLINQNMYTENRLADYVASNNLNRRRADFVSMTIINNESNILEFPELTYSDLILVALGTYQLKQARSYYGEHIRANGAFVIEVCREVENVELSELSNSSSLFIVRGRIQSRHIGRKIYFVYVLVDSTLRGRNALVQYCCNCLVGRRTVGCCAHVMSIVWYLGWARYQENLTPPAQFLDDILIVYDQIEE